MGTPPETVVMGHPVDPEEEDEDEDDEREELCSGQSRVTQHEPFDEETVLGEDTGDRTLVVNEDLSHFPSFLYEKREVDSEGTTEGTLNGEDEEADGELQNNNNNTGGEPIEEDDNAPSQSPPLTPPLPSPPPPAKNTFQIAKYLSYLVWGREKEKEKEEKEKEKEKGAEATCAEGDQPPTVVKMSNPFDDFNSSRQAAEVPLQAEPIEPEVARSPHPSVAAPRQQQNRKTSSKSAAPEQHARGNICPRASCVVL